jgi:ABC-2 type transport system permease protein
MLGRFDFGFVVVFVLPLVILALSYNMVSVEREQGTLPMVLVQPVRLATLVIGKVALRSMIVVGTVAIASGVGGAVAAFQIGSPVAGGRLLLWLGLIVAYGLFWFALAAAVNAFGYSSAANATVLAAVWLGFAVVIPGLIDVAASVLHPLPSRMRLVTATREATAEAEARGRELLAEFYGDHPELMPRGRDPDMDSFHATRVSVAEAVDSIAGPLRRRFDQQLDRQRRLTGRYRFASPVVLAYDLLSDVAGTGLARHGRFRRQVAEFQASWAGVLVPKMYRGERLTPGDYDGLPRFRFAEEPERAAATRVVRGSIGLWLPTVGLALAALIGFRRYRVAGG